MLHKDYIINHNGIKADAKRQEGHSMSNFENDNLYLFEKQAKQERASNPDAFLMSEKESALLARAAECINKVLAPYARILEQVKLDEKATTIFNDIFTSFEDNQISIKKLQALLKKYCSSYFWSLEPGIVKKEDDNHLLITAATLNYKVVVNSGNAEEELEKTLTSSEIETFFKAKTMQERLKVLGLKSDCLYISRYDLNTLDNLTLVLAYYDVKTKNTALQLAPDARAAFFMFVSSPIMNAPNDIGSNAKKPMVIKTKNGEGKTISETRYKTKSGIVYKLSDFNPNGAIGFITVGDPNTDKLLLQAQLKAMETGQKIVEIPIKTDFCEFRGLSSSDSKEATKQAESACCRLRRAGYDFDTERITGGINFVQEAFVDHRGTRAGNVIVINFSDAVYEHIMEMSEKGQQIEVLDKKIVTIPNDRPIPYNIARKLSHHVKFNVDKKNSHAISVKALINSCPTLPLYPESAEDRNKENYIKYPSYAPALIIKPFVKALDYLVSFGILKHYKFTKGQNRAVSDIELSEALKDYKKFTTLNIVFEFVNEPDYKHLIEAKAKQREKAEAKKDKNK